MPTTATNGVFTDFINSINKNTLSNSGRTLQPEQQDLLQSLYNYAKTGNYNNIYQGGTEYSGSLGYYQLGEGEKEAKGALEDLMSSGMPESLRFAKEEIGKVLNEDYYDPYNEKGSFGGFKKNVQNELQDNSDVLKRNLAVQGDLYSTRLIQEQGNLAESAQDALTGKLGELYDTYTQRRLSATNTAVGIGQLEEQINLSRIARQAEFGQIERTLKDQEAKDKYSEWMRGRSEINDILSKAQNIFNADYNGSSSGSSSSSSSGSSPVNSDMIWDEVKSMYPEGTSLSILQAAYQDLKGKADSITNPFGVWNYEGSSPGTGFGRKNDSPAPGWVFQG